MTLEEFKQSEPFFDSWYVEGKIGAGRSSDSFRVTRIVGQNRQSQCLKVIHFPKSDLELHTAVIGGKFANEREYLEHLEKKVRRNVEIMLRLRTNPYIVRYDDYEVRKVERGFDVYVLMELLTPLSTSVRAGSFTPSQAAEMGVDLCRALEGFRSAGIMHTDIKPSNIYISSDGRYKLGDFGVDLLTKEERSGENSAYLAPELITSSGNAVSADIYSVGLILYQFLNHNRMPFYPPYPAPVTLSDRQEAFRRRMNGETVPAAESADAEIMRILKKALAYSPADRYREPGSMLLDLSRYGTLLSDMPKNRRPEAARYSPAASERKEFMEAFEDDPDDDRPEKKKRIVPVIIIFAVLLILSVLTYLVTSGKLFGGNDAAPPAVPAAATTLPGPAQETTAPPEVTTTQAPPETEAPTETEAQASETTDETTTEPSTEETTEAATAEPTTPEPTQPPTTGPTSTRLYMDTDKKDGDMTSESKIYTRITKYELTYKHSRTLIGKEVLREINVRMTDIGSNPKPGAKAYLCRVNADGLLVNRCELEFETYSDVTKGREAILVSGTPVDSVEYDDDSFYYVVFEQGAVVTDTAVMLPLQIPFGKKFDSYKK